MTFTGSSPIVVSSDVIVESARKYAAFATSEISARVGKSECTIDDNICVATIAGRFNFRHSRKI